MQNLDLRPLSLGEILDRTFTLYKNNFVLFAGISMIPQLLVLAFQMIQVFFMKIPQIPGQPNMPPVFSQWQASAASSAGLVAGILIAVLLAIGLVVAVVVAHLLANGATVFAVSELYMGRPATVRDSLRSVRGHLGTLFGVAMLTGLACMLGLIFLIIPGIYIFLRLSVSVPAAVVEDLGARSSLERSYELTRTFGGRAFLIYLLCFLLALSLAGMLQMPFSVGMVLSLKNPATFRFWAALAEIGKFISNVLVTPVGTIATSLFYYDLRVRKEAFDLQVMMGAENKTLPGSAGVPSMLS